MVLQLGNMNDCAHGIERKGRWNGAEMSQMCSKCHDARHGILKVVDGASMSACSGGKSCMKSDG